MLRPLPNAMVNPYSLKDFFPTYHRYKPIANGKKHRASNEIAEDLYIDNQSTPSIEKPIDLDYMKMVLGHFDRVPYSRIPLIP